MSKNPTPVAKLCNDSLKYVLLNAVNVATKGVVLPKVYFKSRVNLYKNMYNISTSAKTTTVKPKHLYAIAYSRYYTLRHIIHNRELEVPEYEDDLQIKEEFKRMMSEAHTSKTSFENAFFKIIKGLKTPEVYKLYRDLDDHLLQGPVTADEVVEFVVATSETDIFIANKLSKDVDLFTSEFDQFVKAMKEYHFVNGWVTSAGVSIFAAAVTYSKFLL